MTSPRIGRQRAAVQYAAPRAVRDPRIGPAAHLVHRAGLSDTPGGAHQLMLRRRQDLLEVVRVLAREHAYPAIDLLLAPLDEVREAGLQVALDAVRLATIERRDAEDNCSRSAFLQDPTPENARRAIADARRLIIAAHEFIRGVRTRCPELA